MARRKRKAKGGGDDVERLASQCRQLATALREWLDAPGGQLRAKDGVFLRLIAGRLDDLAIDITSAYNRGTPSQVRELTTWAALGLSAIGAGAGVFSAAKDAHDWGEDSAQVFVVDRCLPPDIVTLAVESLATANIVINLPDDALRPLPPVETVEVAGDDGATPSEDHHTTARLDVGASAVADTTGVPVVVEGSGSLRPFRSTSSIQVGPPPPSSVVLDNEAEILRDLGPSSIDPSKVEIVRPLVVDEVTTAEPPPTQEVSTSSVEATGEALPPTVTTESPDDVDGS